MFKHIDNQSDLHQMSYMRCFVHLQMVSHSCYHVGPTEEVPAPPQTLEAEILALAAGISIKFLVKNKVEVCLAKN